MTDHKQDTGDIPELEVTLAPYLCSRDARKAIAFYEQALGGRADGAPWEEPSGHIAHATVRFSKTAIVHLSDPYPDFGTSPHQVEEEADEDGGDAAGPKQPTRTAKMCLIVRDVDACVKRVVEMGGKVLKPVFDESTLGRRSARILDLDGHIWLLSQTVRKVPEDELEGSRVHFQKTGQFK